MISVDRHGPETQTFDLSDLIRSYRKFRVGPRALGALFLVVGLGFTVYIIYLLLTRLNTSDLAWRESGIIMAAVGVVIAGAAWPLATESRGYPTSLLVTGSRLEFRRDPDILISEVAWDDPRFIARLIDRRGLPAMRTDGKPRNQFSLKIKRSSLIPIPQEAFELILDHATKHGLSVSRQTVRGAGVPGTYEVIVVRGTKE